MTPSREWGNRGSEDLSSFAQVHAATKRQTLYLQLSHANTALFPQDAEPDNLHTHNWESKGISEMI